MQYTISDFLATYGNAVRLLAGGGGLSRSVNEVGILDYELAPGVKASYLRSNFYEGQLVLTSFLYARDEPYLVTEAVKQLVRAGASGLAIKNVFHLEIPDAALRFAAARNFPLILIVSDRLYFDNVIIDVGLRVRELADSSFSQHEIDALLGDAQDEAAVRDHARRLNPSFGEEAVATYAMVGEEVTPALYATFEARYKESGLNRASDLFCVFDEGLLLIVSGDDVSQADADEAAGVLLHEVVGSHARAVGIGEPHQGLGELADVVLEALHAARMAAMRKEAMVRYADLGILRAILPHAGTHAMRRFSDAIMLPLRDFDAENNACLVTTLETFLASERSINAAAEALCAHPNTVRYRLEQVRALTGLDWRTPHDAEQLSLAWAIEVARDLISS